MNTTIQNLELTITMVESEFTNQNVPEIKTLMNTYKNLLHRFLRKPIGDKSVLEYKDILMNQQVKLNELFTKVEKAIATSLVNRSYKDADNLVIVSERIEQSTRDISQIFKEGKRYKNFTQQGDKYEGRHV